MVGNKEIKYPGGSAEAEICLVYFRLAGHTFFTHAYVLENEGDMPILGSAWFKVLDLTVDAGKPELSVNEDQIKKLKNGNL